MFATCMASCTTSFLEESFLRSNCKNTHINMVESFDGIAPRKCAVIRFMTYHGLVEHECQLDELLHRPDVPPLPLPAGDAAEVGGGDGAALRGLVRVLVDHVRVLALIECKRIYMCLRPYVTNVNF